MKEIKKLVEQYRQAIDLAWKEGCFAHDICFYKFPRACCGDVSVLLGHYLLLHGIKTNYVCGTYYGGGESQGQSHAWLELSNGLIIDITGDQFENNADFLNYNKPVYIGGLDELHRLFEAEKRDIRESVTISELGSICYPRLKELYDIIDRYIE